MSAQSAAGVFAHIKLPKPPLNNPHRSRQKPRFLPAADRVMSAESAARRLSANQTIATTFVLQLQLSYA
jgi:hypothetical protein